VSTTCLVACVGSKLPRSAQAKQIYTSALFRKSRRYSELFHENWFVLSAKHGLLEPDEHIHPYELTLNKVGRAERRQWAKATFSQILRVCDPRTQFVFLAGERYRQDLVPLLQEAGFGVHTPLAGLPIGKQLQWLTWQADNPAGVTAIRQLYSGLKQLHSTVGEFHYLKEQDLSKKIPRAGVYVFFDASQVSRTALGFPRVVRVGTHAVSQGSSSTLWNRLRTHRGSLNGLGNHRSSIFRLHVGAAILNRQALIADYPTWGIGQSASKPTRLQEQEVERQVSRYLADLPFLYLPVEDAPTKSSDRAFIERNMIGLLTGADMAVEEPPPRWLGSYSPQESIWKSGLWNIDHLGYLHRDDFFDIFQRYLSYFSDGGSPPQHSIAPKEWHLEDRHRRRCQLRLF